MTWTVVVLALCLAGHPDRCELYRLDTNAPVAACQIAAHQWLATRTYLVGIAISCREEKGA